MSIIITLIVWVVVFGLVWWLLTMLPLPAPFVQIIRVLFVLLLIVVILSAFGILPGGHVGLLRLH